MAKQKLGSPVMRITNNIILKYLIFDGFNHIFIIRITGLPLLALYGRFNFIPSDFEN